MFFFKYIYFKTPVITLSDPFGLFSILCDLCAVTSCTEALLGVFSLIKRLILDKTHNERVGSSRSHPIALRLW